MTHTLDIAVRFAETDLMGIVHHSAYVVWLEAGRVAWMQAMGTPYAELSASGRHFAVTGLHVNYRASCTFGDVVRIETTLSSARSRQVVFGYRVLDANTGELLATGRSEHICVDTNGRMTKIPADLLRRLTDG